MNFKDRYRRECLLKGTSPLHVIEAYLKDSVLNFKFFRIPVTEWTPIFLTLNSDLTLKKICVSIDVVDQHAISSNPNHKQKLKYLHKFLEHLSTHLSNNKLLVELELIGLPITSSDIKKLAEGIKNSCSLQHISFAECKIGDEGCKYLVEVIKTKPNIVWVDLRKCGLTSKASETLHNLVQFQSAARENAVWKASLRQEVPNLDLMGGLRRLTLSDNFLGEAINNLVSALYEDRWIKAVDLQSCNLENSHLNGFINATMKNQSLIFLDVTYNDALNSDLIKQLQHALKTNSSKHPSFIFQPIKLLSSTVSFPKKLCQGISNDLGTSYKTVKSNCNGSTPVTKKQVLKKKIPYTPNRKLLQRTIEGSNTKQAIRQPRSNTTEDYLKEQEMRNNAERHVIKIYQEMELAWTRIAKLEKEVGQLSRQNGISIVASTISEDTSHMVKNTRSGNDSSRHNFEACLRRLQVVLKELRFASAAQVMESKNPSKETQNILDIVHAAVQEVALNTGDTGSGIPRRSHDFEMQHPQDLQSNLKIEGFLTRDRITNDHISSASRNKIRITSTPDWTSAAVVSRSVSAIEEDSININGKCINGKNSLKSKAFKANNPKTQTHNDSTHYIYLSRSSSSNEQSEQLEKSTSRSCRNPSHVSSEKSQKESSLKKSDFNVLPLTNSGTRTVRPQESSLRYSPASDRSLPRKKSKESAISTSDEQSRNAERVNSLKSLQSNLEDLLTQLRGDDDDKSSKHNSVELRELDSFASTLKGNLPDLSMANHQETDSNYSLDGFDSLSNSVQPNLEMSTKFREFGVLDEDNKKRYSNHISQEKNTSCTSSSLNLSSIVDLLGNFSVEDIGSSTLTPP